MALPRCAGGRHRLHKTALCRQRRYDASAKAALSHPFALDLGFRSRPFTRSGNAWRRQVGQLGPQGQVNALRSALLRPPAGIPSLAVPLTPRHSTHRGSAPLHGPSGGLHHENETARKRKTKIRCTGCDQHREPLGRCSSVGGRRDPERANPRVLDLPCSGNPQAGGLTRYGICEVHADRLSSGREADEAQPAEQQRREQPQPHVGARVARRELLPGGLACCRCVCVRCPHPAAQAPFPGPTHPVNQSAGMVLST